MSQESLVDGVDGGVAPFGLDLLDAVPTAIVIHDPSGWPYFANRQARALFVGDPNSVLSAKEIAAAAQIYVADTDIRYPLERLAAIEDFSESDHRVEDMEMRRLGGTVHLEVWAKATSGPDGQPSCVVHSFVDASERKNTDADLKLTESLANAVATAPGFADVLETSLREICQLTGWTFGQAWLPDAAGAALRCRYAWHERSVALREFHEACRAVVLPLGRGLPGRVWLSKQWEWNADTVDPSLAGADQAVEGLPTGHRGNVAMPVVVEDDVVAVLEFFVLVGGSQDQRSLDRVAAVISRVGLWMSTKGAEDAGRRSEHKFRQIAETTTDAIAFASADGRILYLNPAAQRLFGYTAEESTGRLLGELVRDRTQPNGDATLGRYAKLGQGGLTAPPIYLTAVCKDGREIPVEVTLTSWDQGEETFLTVIVRDASERVHTEQRLRDALGVERKALVELQVLDGLKYTVLQALAHDLRTPLAAVLILTSILRADGQGGRQLSPQSRAPLLTDIERSVRQMQRILQDLLDSDPQQSIEARRGRADVGDLVARVLADNALAATHPVHTAIDSVVINIDEAQVERIVDNLLNNAARHLSGGVPVWISTAASGDGVLIVVEDAGEGVPADMAEEIFEPFRRGAGSTAHGVGIGLGLSLVSRFAQLHGGRAWVQDRPGGGASFRVYLPNSQTAAPDPGATPVASGRVRVVLCDDDQILRDALAMLIRSDDRLELLGEPSQTGQDVIDAAVRHLPDVVLMDVELIGEMNGFEATSQIRELCPTTSVVIMSGVADPAAARVQALQAGAAAFLPKSQDAHSMLDAVLAAARS